MKFMNMKRFASVAMAGALTLSLAAPAFATSSTPSGQVTITGSYKDIPIAVSVPTTGTAQINPYGLPVEIKKTVGTASIVGQKITTMPMSIKNQGSVDLAVKAGLTVTPKGELHVVTNVGNSDTAKNAAVKLQVVALSGTDYAVPSTDVQLENKLIDVFATEATWTGAAELAATASTAGASGQPDTAGTEAKSASSLAVLGAATVGNGGIVTYGNNSIALFRLTGDVVAEPTDAWTEDDGFEAKVVFKFTPAQPATVSLDNTSLALGTTANTTKTAAVVFNAGDTDLTVKSYAWTADPASGVVTLTGDSTDTVTVTTAGVGTATLTCVVTLSDNTTKTLTCAVEVDAANN